MALREATKQSVFAYELAGITVRYDLPSTMREANLIGRPHATDIYSPPRATSPVQQFNLRPGFALDSSILVDYDGETWDFDIPAKREQAKRLLRYTKPGFSPAAPICTAFSLPHVPKKAKHASMDMERNARMWCETSSFCCALYTQQVQA